jgi:HAD superfamily hydrolase (TIGR01509 family)
VQVKLSPIDAADPRPAHPAGADRLTDDDEGLGVVHHVAGLDLAERDHDAPVTLGLMAILAVIFDCDGVLADSEPAWAEAERKLCLTYGVDLDQSPRATTTGMAAADALRLLLPALPEDQIEGAERLLNAIALRSIPERVRPMQGAVDLVTRLARVMPVGVASNSPRVILRQVLGAIGIAPLITTFVGADDVALPKPAPDVYLRTCELLGRSSHEVLVLEDSSTGIDSALAAGCPVIQVGGTAGGVHSGADGSISSLEAPWTWLDDWLTR